MLLRKRPGESYLRRMDGSWPHTVKPRIGYARGTFPRAFPRGAFLHGYPLSVGRQNWLLASGDQQDQVQDKGGRKNPSKSGAMIFRRCSYTNGWCADLKSLELPNFSVSTSRDDSERIELSQEQGPCLHTVRIGWHLEGET